MRGAVAAVEAACHRSRIDEPCGALLFVRGRKAANSGRQQPAQTNRNK